MMIQNLSLVILNKKNKINFSLISSTQKENKAKISIKNSSKKGFKKDKKNKS